MTEETKQWIRNVVCVVFPDTEIEWPYNSGRFYVIDPSRRTANEPVSDRQDRPTDTSPR